MSLRVTSSGGCGAALLWVMAAGWSAAVVFFSSTRIAEAKLRNSTSDELS